MHVECVVASRCLLGESPTWHAASRSLFWADITAGRLHRLYPDGRHEAAAEGVVVGGITVEKDGSLLLLGPSARLYRFQDGAVRTWRGGTIRWFGYRFNDCIADARGRVLAGLMGYQRPLTACRAVNGLRRRLQQRRVLSSPGARAGVLCRLSDRGRAIPVSRQIHRPNGMAFAPDGATLYATDSGRRRILAFPYDVRLGALGTPRVVAHTEGLPGVPDGLAADQEGCLWSAQNGAGRIVRYAPDGRRIGWVELPTPYVTSLAFGGADEQSLYVTTAAARARPDDELAGSVFRLRVNVKGGTVFSSNLWTQRDA